MRYLLLALLLFVACAPQKSPVIEAKPAAVYPFSIDETGKLRMPLLAQSDPVCPDSFPASEYSSHLNCMAVKRYAFDSKRGWFVLAIPDSVCFCPTDTLLFDQFVTDRPIIELILHDWLDANGDGKVTIVDLTYLIGVLFQGKSR